MTKLTFVVAAVVAVAACTNAASAGSRSHAPSRHAQATTANTAVNCVRAPNVGAFASDPYTSPPCMPNTAN
jgi:hypothetical protein